MDQNNSPWQKMFRYASAGSEFIVTFGLFLVGGILLDSKLQTSPGLTLTGAVAGFALGLYRLVKVAQQAQRDLNDKDRDSHR